MRDLIEKKLNHSVHSLRADHPLLNSNLMSLLRKLRLGRLMPAAVLVPIVERSSGLTVLLTQRAEHLKHHPGQISFPGGRIEEQDEGPVEAALREAQEEVGMDPAHVTVVGFLDKYLTITGYTVTPVVGFVDDAFVAEVDHEEAADAFEVPLDFLMDPKNHVPRRESILDHAVTIYEIHYGERNIWGATAGMLVNFYEKLYK